MTIQYFHIVLNPKGEAEFWATKFLPITEKTGCRLKAWRINCFLEQIEKPIVRQWSYLYDSQIDELQDLLGPDYKVLRQWETLNAVTAHYKNATK